MAVAIAAQCRANFGDDRLFEVAFTRMEAHLRTVEKPPSPSEVLELKQKMYELDATEGENPFLKGFCDTLRGSILEDE